MAKRSANIQHEASAAGMTPDLYQAAVRFQVAVRDSIDVSISMEDALEIVTHYLRTKGMPAAMMKFVAQCHDQKIAEREANRAAERERDRQSVTR